MFATATVGAGILAVCCCISCFGVYVCRCAAQLIPGQPSLGSSLPLAPPLSACAELALWSDRDNCLLLLVCCPASALPRPHSLRRRVKRQAKFLERLGASNWREWLQLRRGSSGSDSNSQPGRAKFSPLDSAPGELSEEEVLGQAPVPAETGELPSHSCIDRSTCAVT